MGAKESWKIYLELLKASAQSQMSYRTSYFYEMLGMILMSIVHILSVYFLFDKFFHVGGWSFWEVVYLYGVATMAMAISQLASSGLNQFAEFIRTGEFDRYLIRPISPLLHILPHEFALHRLGRLLQGSLAIAVAIYMMELNIGAIEVWLILSTVCAMALTYFSLFLMGATTTFWTVQSTEVFNAFTYGGLELSKFPVSIYQPWLRNIFIFLIPIGFVSYFPSVALLDKPDPLNTPNFIYYLAPIVAITFFLLAIKFWKFGIKHYQSTGS